MLLRPASVPGCVNLRCGAKLFRERRSEEEVQLSSSILKEFLIEKALNRLHCLPHFKKVK
jgi:hypothetical protein